MLCNEILSHDGEVFFSKSLNRNAHQWFAYKHTRIFFIIYCTITMTQTQFITSESVSEGHPDKLCDQISDGVLDAMLAQDPESRVACECLTTTGLVVVAGEVTTDATIDVQTVVRNVIKKAGYTDASYGIDGNHCSVLIALHEQSLDIAQWVNTWEWLHSEQGAGDQWIMYGFATNETPQLMPLPITLAHGLTRRLAHVRKEEIVTWMRPDSKAQVTVEYKDGKAKRVDAIVISTQHDPDVTNEQIITDVKQHVIQEVCGEWIDENTTFHINPTGIFVVGGPHGDAGLTWRKIIIDTYGGVWRHGGWAFSGKDPSKVDRSAAYMARYVAKNIVASWVCEKCEIQLSYAIGVAQPTSVYVDCYGTEKVALSKIVQAVEENFDLSPAGIISTLDLKRPIYSATAAYGHFWRDEFSREKTDKKEIFEALV